MGSDLNLPKSLTQLSAPPPPQPLEQSQKSNMPMLYYGLVVVATAAIVLAIYNLLIVRWCTNQYRRSREEANELVFRRSSNTTNTRNNNPQSYSLHHGDSTIGLTTTSSFRYRKGIEEDANSKALQLEYDMECSVCLSVFEEGEEVKKLPRCNHWFHAACIDMWLYSHADCPLCRAPVLVVDPSSRHPDSENSRDGLLLDTSTSSV